MTDGNLVGFSPTSANTPTGSPPVARNSSIGHSNITNAQLDFKTWFFQTAAQNPPETTEAKSPRQLRRALRRAWKALEQSPYYKTLRSEHTSGNFQNVNFKELEDAFISASKSAPGSPKHRSPKRKRAKSAGKIVAKQSSSESPKMRPSSAAPAKVRPFSAGSVGSSSSSEGSESGTAASGGDDSKKNLIPLTKRIFPPSKVRPKSSGILKKTDHSSTQSLPQQSMVGGGSTSTVLTTVDETQSTSHSPRFKSSANMVIDSGNVTSDTAQLVSQPDHSDTGSTRSSIKSASSKKLSKFAAAASKKDDGKKHFADLKIIDETSKRLGSAKSSSKPSSATPRSSFGGQQKGPKRTGVTALKATLASVQSTTSMASSLSSHSSAQPLQSEGFAQSATIPEQDVGDGSSSKGSKDAKSSDKSFSSASASTAGPRSSIRKSSDQKSDQKAGSERTSDAGSSSKDSGTKEPAKKEASAVKDSKKPGSKEGNDSVAGGKKPSSDDLSKAAAAAATTTAAATMASANATVVADPNAAPEAPSEKTEADPKAPLKREMSRISVKTNESRKSIDMSKHIMNLIQGGQNQEEQTKKPQTTNQSYIQQAIPALPMTAAVLCLFLNLVAPGIGTILSGFFVICIGKPRIEAKENALGLTIFVNFFVGISQLMTVTFFFVGWFWSMVWGINLIINSIEYGEEMKVEREKELQQTAMRAFGFIRADAAPAVDE